MHRITLLASAALLLASCASPPKPPTVSGKHRTVVNSIIVYASNPRPAQISEGPARVAPAGVQPDRRLSITFPWNKWKFQPTPEQAVQLRRLLAGNIDHVNVRGRTDGPAGAGDERVARRRAAAAKDWLVGQGIPGERIFVSYVSAGDYQASNLNAAGRASNRRVDIEIIHN
ncbi:OmpA family protein [Stenotrophomonas maltophilia]|uniref:OmpA family protein n=1 Tax=Stenotrophomonas maltophilia TaxID=40324 RepID=UPI000DA88478|nr:OmpA family protein [Stenotrophomonas maltophilia]PZT16816.1 hypothetical protein A7X86_13645 [Stenotrophomonas maltophilia]UVH75403.1 OmpA family protein [Stenotrophomonas maltophilia]HDS1667629.1 OmpA family protein [Stenotrophomonas maltophilia]